MQNIRKIFVALAVVFASGLLFVNVYNSIVDAPNWSQNIPASVHATRDYFAVANPGSFFRLFSPAHQVLTLIALVLCWRSGKSIRYMLAVALLIAVGVDVFTFAYFYPRLVLLYSASLANDVDAVRTAISEWAAMNWVRSGMLLVNVVLDLMVYTRVVRWTGEGSGDLPAG